MSIEPVRACGFRKVGGLYLVSSSVGEICHRLPHGCAVCPTCGVGIRPARAWTWVDAVEIFRPGCSGLHDHCGRCVVCRPALFELAPAGLVWIGERFYNSPGHFLDEAAELGISRRVPALPRGFELGSTWVLLGHRLAVRTTQSEPRPGELIPGVDMSPGIFHVFRPERVERLVWKSDATDEAREAAAARGITLVEVPDGDEDHSPRGEA